MMKFILSLACLILFSISSKGQGVVPSQNVSHQIEVINKHMVKQDATMKLNEIQVIKLESLLTAKESRKSKVNLTSMDKKAIYDAYKSIDEEFQPDIEAIFSVKQKEVFRANFVSKD